MKRFFFGIFLLCIFFLLPQQSYAQAYDATYRFDFYPQKDGKVDAQLNISLDSTQSDVYINEFTISIPHNFFSEKLIASIDTDGIDYKVESKKEGKRIIFTFDEPTKSISSNHTIKLSYSNDDLYLKGAYVDELILPLIKTSDTSKVYVTLHLPNSEDKPVSLIKPKATVVHQNIIEWKNVKEDTLYVQFGSSNIYDAHLTYSLINPELRSVSKAITLPPDTIFQKIYVEKLEPKPEKIVIDEDDNYIAYYNLGPRERINIDFVGVIQVFSKSRSESLKQARISIERQKNYLLSEQKLWSLGSYYSNEDIKQLKTPESIYAYLVKEFVYNPNRLKSAPERRGAFESLQDTLNSICTDFTDSFISIAREKGILAREIEGYGYATRKDIRPLSLNADMLHSWPEYYSAEREVWVPIDPTWAQASGINYFDAFDVMHIALAIHGKNAEQPLPAGFNKKPSSKSIDIKPAKKLPSDKRTIQLTSSIPSKIISLKKYTSKVFITNTSNVFLYDLHLTVVSDGIAFDNNNIAIDIIAPMQTKEVNINYSTTSNTSTIDRVAFLFDGKEIESTEITIQNQQSYSMQIILGIIIVVIILLGSFFIVKLRKK
jgi:hypothetical protein